MDVLETTYVSKTFVQFNDGNAKLAVHAGGSGHNGGEKRNVLVVSVLLPIAVNFAQRSEPQGGVKVLGMR
jgi:hypothetical protein